MNQVDTKKLKKYYEVTEKALELAKQAPENLELEKARERFLDMIERYISDAKHFESEGKIVDAFAAINYAHGWLDAGAIIGLWDVHDNSLFTRD